jgi:hypothetical protein
MNGECGGIVSRAEACAASPDDGLVSRVLCPFGDIDVATVEVLFSSAR